MFKMATLYNIWVLLGIGCIDTDIQWHSADYGSADLKGFTVIKLHTIKEGVFTVHCIRY